MTTLIFFLGFFLNPATDPYPRNQSIDIAHYTFRLEVNDTTNVIAGLASVTVRFRKPLSEFSLNLISKNADELGMAVFDVTSSGKPVAFKHESDLLTIYSPLSFPSGDTATFHISYGGVPIDGMVIGKNKFGDRSFFGDNWPDRGRHWLPTIDHPYDKAPVDFIVTAPDHYEVVATGKLVSEKSLGGKRKEHHWHESVDVAVKVITVGIAEFSVKESGLIGNIPITTWVFPQNDTKGFKDFAVAPATFKFMQDYVGPYSYEKLAHVQSKTRFGGLENASNIFYFENSVTGKKEIEGLIAHETAHQWFGNSVTESDWHHVWLSEGFATYFAALYLGNAHGEKRLVSQMVENRDDVLKYYQIKKTPIIDTTITDINKVLNTNTYQKAAWFLHMLRERIGEEAFHNGVRSYYKEFQNLNATTADFQSHVEAASGKDLKEFFRLWLYQPGHPQLDGTWSYDEHSKKLKIDILVSGFALPADSKIGLVAAYAGGSRVKSLEYHFDRDATGLTVEMGEKPMRVFLDPATVFLFEGEMKEKP